MSCRTPWQGKNWFSSNGSYTRKEEDALRIRPLLAHGGWAPVRDERDSTVKVRWGMIPLKSPLRSIYKGFRCDAIISKIYLHVLHN